jgi:hypothetical protein
MKEASFVQGGAFKIQRKKMFYGFLKAGLAY